MFGIALGGEARAYPKRILAWLELAGDRVGGQELTIVYCTLCGTVIPYGSEVGGVRRTFGTSGPAWGYAVEKSRPSSRHSPAAPTTSARGRIHQRRSARFAPPFARSIRR